MSEKLYCLVNPVSPLEGETYEENIQLGMAWYGLLVRAGIRIIAPQFLLLRSLDDKDYALRQLGMQIMANAMLRCDGIISVGVRYSTGMRGEIIKALDANLDWHDMVGFRSPCDFVCDSANTGELRKVDDEWVRNLVKTHPNYRPLEFPPGAKMDVSYFEPCRDESACAVDRVKQGWAT